MARYWPWRPNPARSRNFLDSSAHGGAHDLCRPLRLWDRNLVYGGAGFGLRGCLKSSMPAVAQATVRLRISLRVRRGAAKKSKVLVCSLRLPCLNLGQKSVGNDKNVVLVVSANNAGGGIRVAFS